MYTDIHRIIAEFCYRILLSMGQSNLGKICNLN